MSEIEGIHHIEEKLYAAKKKLAKLEAESGNAKKTDNKEFSKNFEQIYNKAFKPKRISLFDKFRLFFIKSRYSVSHFDGIGIEYKLFKGTFYIIKEFKLFPNHFNCRCD